MAAAFHLVAGNDLSAEQVYEIWKIRDAVFAVEQRCDELDADDLDLLESTSHLWFADGSVVVAYLRFLTHNPAANRLGRVCTVRDWRGRGLAGELLRAAHQRWGAEPIAIGAQAHLESWYRTFGYATTGEAYLEAGIKHVPMTRAASHI